VLGLHFGRYGLSRAENQKDQFGAVLQPMFLGYESLVRGYDYQSFNASECTQGLVTPGNTTACPAFDRLFGQRIAVANLELRVPFIGVQQYGLINFPFLPTELVAFADGGLAWDPTPAKLTFARTSGPNEHIPIFSTGFSARVNVLGMLVLEAYYTYPWQRPQKGWIWGFDIYPGW